jgi:hypothetical protein
MLSTPEYLLQDLYEKKAVIFLVEELIVVVHFSYSYD